MVIRCYLPRPSVPLPLPPRTANGLPPTPTNSALNIPPPPPPYRLALPIELFIDSPRARCGIALNRCCAVTWWARCYYGRTPATHQRDGAWACVRYRHSVQRPPPHPAADAYTVAGWVLRLYNIWWQTFHAGAPLVHSLLPPAGSQVLTTLPPHLTSYLPPHLPVFTHTALFILNHHPTGGAAPYRFARTLVSWWQTVGSIGHYYTGLGLDIVPGTVERLLVVATGISLFLWFIDVMNFLNGGRAISWRCGRFCLPW